MMNCVPVSELKLCSYEVQAKMVKTVYGVLLVI